MDKEAESYLHTCTSIENFYASFQVPSPTSLGTLSRPIPTHLYPAGIEVPSAYPTLRVARMAGEHEERRCACSAHGVRMF
eukprot:1986401-Rhodomonas_salina.1